METTEKAFPFDSDEVNGKPDREYLAEDFARYFAAFITSGVFMNTADELQVIANGDMSVILRPGSLISMGYRYDNTTNLTLTLDPADGVLSRIDRIAVVWDKKLRDLHAEVRKGTPSYNPIAPDLRRNAEYRDYIVADILIGAGVVSISQTAITDQRLNSAVCGLALPWATIDTTELFAQLNAFYNETVADNQSWEESYRQKREAFADREEQNFIVWSEGQKNIILAWYEAIKGKLSGDVGVELANQIQDIQDTRMIQTYISPAYVGGGYTWSDYTLEKLTINKMLLASIMEPTDITNAYNNGVAPVQQAGILTQYTGQKANGYATYVTNTGELYINAAESVFGTWSGWKKVEPDEATDEEVDAAFNEVWG